MDSQRVRFLLRPRIVKPEIWTMAMGPGPTGGDIILKSVNMPACSWLANRLEILGVYAAY